MLTPAAKQKHPRVSVILVNWNGLVHLPECLASLQNQIFRDFEVILVDNGSTDDSVAYVLEHHPWVKLIALGKNTGFATGNNRGFEQAHGDYLVTLNNDTRVAPDWLETLVSVADAYPAAGMVGSRIVNFDEPDIIDSLGLAICLDGMARGRYRNRRWSTLCLNDVEDILAPSACAALYKRKMLAVTGFFDDDFFAYCEDVDLGLRGRLAGWSAVLATEAVVYHKYSQTGGRLSPFKIRLVERNHFWAAIKTLPAPWLWALPATTALRYVRQLQSLCCRQGTGGQARGQGSSLKLLFAALQGTFEALCASPTFFRKRQQIMKSRTLSSRAMTALLKKHRLSFRALFDMAPPVEKR